MTSFLPVVLWLLTTGSPQQATPPAAAASTVDSPHELDQLKATCGAFQIAGCAEDLLTAQPLHVAVGSIAPQNGFAAGLAYVGHKTTTNWRTNFDADGVVAPSGAWRAGLYVRMVDTHQAPIGIHFGTANTKPNLTELPEHPVVALYAQEISLPDLNYFGLGPATTLAGGSVFAMREFIGGVSAVKPFTTPLHLSVYGEANERSVSVSASTGETLPSIGTLYNEATAPGLTAPTSFLQLGEGIRLRPVLFDDALRLSYDVSMRHFLALNNSALSFNRLVVDLSHDFALYRLTTIDLTPRDANGPDECALSTDAPSCSVNVSALATACRAGGASTTDCHALSRNLQGRLGFRVLFSDSFAGSGHTVPFYFQPTLGGSDVNGDPSLGSYEDYRFRASTVLLLRETFEQSIWGPVGFALLVDEGKVALSATSLGSSAWLYSVSAGLTIRAGGAPEVYILYARGGPEGTHVSFTINTSLLGGSSRPSIF